MYFLAKLRQSYRNLTFVHGLGPQIKPRNYICDSEKKLVSAVKLKVTYVLKLIARFGRHCHLLIQ